MNPVHANQFAESINLVFVHKNKIRWIHVDLNYPLSNSVLMKYACNGIISHFIKATVIINMSRSWMFPFLETKFITLTDYCYVHQISEPI